MEAFWDGFEKRALIYRNWMAGKAFAEKIKKEEQEKNKSKGKKK